MAALIRKLVKVAPPRALTFIIVLVGGLSSVATDAGYLILIPLGAAAFLSVGRHPLAGLAAAYAGVSAGFAVNVLHHPARRPAHRGHQRGDRARRPERVDRPHRQPLVRDRLDDLRRHRHHVRRRADHRAEPRHVRAARTTCHVDEEVPEGEARGLRFATWAALAAGRRRRAADGAARRAAAQPGDRRIFNDSPLMDSLIFIITMLFLVAGIGYGLGAKTITSSVDVINAITKTFAGLAGLVFLLLLISQFIAYFNFTNMPTVVGGEDGRLPRERRHRRAVAADRLHPRDPDPRPDHPGVAAEVGDLRPDLRARCSCASTSRRRPCSPPTALGDSPMNVITPLMVYLPFIVLVAQRYKKDAGIGTIISLMIPYTIDRARDLADLLRRLVPARHPDGARLPGQALRLQQDSPRQMSIVPSMHVTVPPPTQIVPSSSADTWTRPARPSAVPWLAT